MPTGDLSRENARHECGTLRCVRGTVVRTPASTLQPLWRLFQPYACVCVCSLHARVYLRESVRVQQHTHVPRRSVFAEEGEGSSLAARMKGETWTIKDRESSRRQVNGEPAREYETDDRS